MPRTSLLLCLASLGACAGESHPATTAPRDTPSIAASPGEPSPEHEMLERIEGEDTRYVALPNAGQCPFEPDELPAFRAVDDDHIPSVDLGRTRLTNMDLGDESLADKALLLHLHAATAQVLDCVTLAACYDERSAATGEIEFAFEVNPAGRVRSVDVEPSADLARWGVAACARRAIYETQFPAYDGADMIVSYRLEID